MGEVSIQGSRLQLRRPNVELPYLHGITHFVTVALGSVVRPSLHLFSKHGTRALSAQNPVVRQIPHPTVLCFETSVVRLIRPDQPFNAGSAGSCRTFISDFLSKPIGRSKSAIEEIRRATYFLES